MHEDIHLEADYEDRTAQIIEDGPYTGLYDDYEGSWLDSDNSDTYDDYTDSVEYDDLA